MSTSIEWVKNPDGTQGETWNPVTGCTPISPGCAHCYAKRMANRLRGRYGYPADEPFRVTLHEDRWAEPTSWRKPRMVFVVSMGDLFHEDVPDEWISEVWAMMGVADWHTYQILTKRPGRMLDFLTRWYRDRNLEPRPNVWLGVTAEDQQRADERIPLLLQCPAARHFVSVEPCLGGVDLTPYLVSGVKTGPLTWNRNGVEAGTKPDRALDHVICGGETGPGARPMHPDWPRKLRDDCQAAGTPFLFKHWGQWGVFTERVKWFGASDHRHFQELKHGDNLAVMQRFANKADVGRLLDGREHNEMPTAKEGNHADTDG